MKKQIALVLILSLLIGLLAACGGTASEVSSAEASIASVEPETAEVSEQPAQPEHPEQPVEDSTQTVESSVSESVEDPPKEIFYKLPLTAEETEFSLYTTAAPGFMTPYIGTDGSYNTAASTLYFGEQTGIKISYIEIDMFSYTEEFNLMIASGDYPDMLTGMDAYTGGLTKALDDEIIIDLTGYVNEEAMPAYVQKLDEANAWADVKTDDGLILGINSLNNAAYVDRGPVVRQDWLDAQGLEPAETYEELTELGKALKSAYGLDYAFFIGATLNPSITLSAGFDVPAFEIGSSGAHFYQVDGEVTSALVSENLKDYLKYLNAWYKDGLISGDFFSRSSMDVKEAFAYDECAICWDNADYITEDNRNTELAEKGFYASALPVTRKTEDQTLHFSLGIDSLVGDALCITTACEDPDLLVTALDWCFTDAGINLSNYGIEGQSYDLDAVGNAIWSENVTDVEGVTFRAALVTYTLTGLPTCWDVQRYWPETYDEAAYSAVELWTNVPNDNAYTMPSALFYTSEESTEYAMYIADVETYAEEFILAAVIGEADLDAKWDEYVDAIWSLGLQNCLDVQQAAYDRYLSRG